MNKHLKKLVQSIKSQDIDDALALYCNLIKNNVDQKDIIKNIMPEMFSVLYRNKYFHVPHGIMGSVAAIDLSQRKSDYSSLAFGQAICYMSSEHSLAPVNFLELPPIFSEKEKPLELFVEYINDGDTYKAYRAFLAMIKDQQKISPDFINDIFKIAMKDTVNMGHKVTYFMKTLELIKYFDKQPKNIFFPAISYIASDPKDDSIYILAQKEYENFKSLNIDLTKNTRSLTSEETTITINCIIKSMRTKSLVHITELLSHGCSIQSISDTIMLAASQLILDTDVDVWIKPIHGFNYCYALNWWIRNFKDPENILALYLQVAFINNLSIEHKRVHFVAASVYVQHSGIIENITRSIESSNVSDSVSLAQSYILSQNNIEEMKQKLISLAIKNGSLKNFTHDLKFASSCINEYEKNSSNSKWLILVALAKHLSQSEKDYSFFNKYKKYLEKVSP